MNKPLADYSPAIDDALQALGLRIKDARVVRQETQALLAERIGVSRRTIQRLEEGSPTTTIVVIAKVLFVYGLLDDFIQIADPNRDTVGSALAKKNRPRRVRAKKTSDHFDNDF